MDLLTVCPDCGSDNTQIEFPGGCFDCLDCGIWFDPRHPQVQDDQGRILAGEEPPRRMDKDDYVVQVFYKNSLVAQETVQAKTWQEARETVQAQYPGLTVSVHSLEVYREATRERGE